jgi:hypothetical protein
MSNEIVLRIVIPEGTEEEAVRDAMQHVPAEIRETPDLADAVRGLHQAAKAGFIDDQAVEAFERVAPEDWQAHRGIPPARLHQPQGLEGRREHNPHDDGS